VGPEIPEMIFFWNGVSLIPETPRTQDRKRKKNI
jgi:hypothetical protein